MGDAPRGVERNKLRELDQVQFEAESGQRYIVHLPEYTAKLGVRSLVAAGASSQIRGLTGWYVAARCSGTTGTSRMPPPPSRFGALTSLSENAGLQFTGVQGGHGGKGSDSWRQVCPCLRFIEAMA